VVTVSEVARRVEAEFEGDPDRCLEGVAPLDRAGPEHLAFFARGGPRAQLQTTLAGAVLVPETFDAELPATTILRVADPQLAFARILPLFHPEPIVHPGIHPTAVLGPGVRVDEDVSLGPNVVVEEGTHIGSGSRVGPSTFIGRDARIGRDCRIAGGVSILHGVVLGDRVVVQPGARIGTEGFGYAETPRGAEKIPQVGGCRLGDDVEVGANCTIDRGALGDTCVGARSKLDNLVHLAHNVVIGEDCMIVAQVGIAGSVTVGDGAAMAGQVGIAGHLTIGAGARIAAQSGVMRDVPAGATHGGYPAQPQTRWMRMNAAALRLPGLVRRMAVLERLAGVGNDEAPPQTDDDASSPRAQDDPS